MNLYISGELDILFGKNLQLKVPVAHHQDVECSVYSVTRYGNKRSTATKNHAAQEYQTD